MDINQVLNSFPLPAVAVEDIRRAGVRMSPVTHGADIMMGHDHEGMAFVFKKVANERGLAKDPKAVKLAKSEGRVEEPYHAIEIIEWQKSKRMKPVARVTDVLEFDEDGSVIGGHPRYVEAYKRWKNNEITPGLPLDKWGQLDVAQVATLVNHGIFSVEQFAEKPSTFVKGKFSSGIQDAHERAIHYVNMNNGTPMDAGLAVKLEEQKQINATLEARLAALEGNKPNKKKKVTEEAVANG